MPLLAYHTKGLIEAGCDEAGRGCLAGPVYAAAVILPKGWKNKQLNDSKQLTEAVRNKLRPLIEAEAVSWAVGIATQQEIDEINILNASFLAMHRAIAALKVLPEALLIDGNRFKPYPNLAHHCIIKGDGKYLSIAAASVLAKTHRDEFMLRAHEKFPRYAWNRNMGYPTKAHRQGIAAHGVTPYHRMTFRLLADETEVKPEAKKTTKA